MASTASTASAATQSESGGAVEDSGTGTVTEEGCRAAVRICCRQWGTRAGTRGRGSAGEKAEAEGEGGQDQVEAILQFETFDQAEAAYAAIENLKQQQPVEQPHGHDHHESQPQRRQQKHPRQQQQQQQQRSRLDHQQRRRGMEAPSTPQHSKPRAHHDDSRVEEDRGPNDGFGDLSYAPKYPGTDMKCRCEDAQQRRAARGGWQRPELGNLEAAQARD